MQKEVLSVFGLGKLGCTMLACFAKKGWNVIGVDINESFVNKVNSAESPIYEPHVDNLIKENKERISATTDGMKAFNDSNISFIIVPTPSLEDGSFSVEYVRSVTTKLAEALKGKESYHLIVITSTVLPGDTFKLTKEIEEISGKVCDKDFGICYNPDFIALGSIVRDFLNPDAVFIGQSSEKSGLMLEDIHHRLTDNEPKIHRMKIHNAELAKISVNAYCTLKITFANTMAEICDNMPEGDAIEVTSALGDDSRIGSKYIKGGLSYGGPCFPRDNRALAFAAKKFNTDAPISTVIDKLNNYHSNERFPMILKNLLQTKSNSTISILGLTYKADTTLVEESAPYYIIKELAKDKNINIKAYDPAAAGKEYDEISALTNVTLTKNAKEAIEDSSVCFIATPWKEFRNIKPAEFKELMSDACVYDAWGMFNFQNGDGIEYHIVGKYSALNT